MPQLDRFLQVMVSNEADSMLLIESEVATLQIDGVPRPITKQPLSAAQLVMLLREIAPADAGTHLQEGKPASFVYRNDDGEFFVRTALTADRWHASIAPHKEGTATPAPPHAISPVNGVAAVAPRAEPKTEPKTEPKPERKAEGPTAPQAQKKRKSAQVAASASPAPSETAPELKPEPVAAAPEPVPPAAPPHRPSGARARVSAPVSSRSEGEITELLRVLVERGASDLHLRVGEPPMLRRHGEISRLEDFPIMDNESLESMLRAVMPGRNRQEYADTNDSDFAYEIDGLARFRGNALRDRLGAGAVFRVIPSDIPTVEKLGISGEVQQLCFLSKGLVLVTGPTGSGKTTTLCALLDLVNRERSDHVITIEDPIEFVHRNKKCIITQRQVGVHTQSFKSALRAALREDPDVILVGELRDLETVSIAIETAETGHLVFGTLHTSTASSTIDRVIDQFPVGEQEQIRIMMAESLKGVISQTLCRKIGGGRAAAREILISMPAVSNLIREGKTFQLPSVIQTSRRLGMITLNDALLELVDSQQVEPKEAYVKAIDKAGLLLQFRSRNMDTSFAEPELSGASKDSGAMQKQSPRPVAARR